MPDLTGSGSFNFVFKGTLENASTDIEGITTYTKTGSFDASDSFVDIRSRTVGAVGETFDLYGGTAWPGRNQCNDIPTFSYVDLIIIKAVAGTLSVGPTTGGTDTWTGGDAPFNARQTLYQGDYIIAYNPEGYAVTNSYKLLKFTGDGVTPTSYDLIIIGRK